MYALRLYVAASHIILALSPEDRISLLAVSDSVISATQHCTHQETMAYANDITKHHLTAFIDDLAKSTGEYENVQWINNHVSFR